MEHTKQSDLEWVLGKIARTGQVHELPREPKKQNQDDKIGAELQDLGKV